MNQKTNKRNDSRSKGFTLVELMVVISIIAVLATIGIMIYRFAQDSAKDAKVKQDMEDIKKAMYQYQAANGNFCLGYSGGCTYSVWVNYAYGAPLNTAINNLKSYLKQKTVFTPQIGLHVENSDEFYIFSSLKNPPATSCAVLDNWDDWYFTGQSYPINYCIEK